MGIGIGDFHKLHALAHEHDFCHQPTEGEEPHWRWKPGQSGNPVGRKKGSKNRATLLAEAMLADKTGAIVEKTIGEALAGDKAALRACFNRVAPTGRGRQIRVDLPEDTTPESLDGAMDATQRAFLAGEISAEEALAVAAWVKARRADENEKLLLEERRLRIEELRLRAEERRMRIKVMRDRYSRIFEDEEEPVEEEEDVAEDGAAEEGGRGTGGDPRPRAAGLDRGHRPRPCRALRRDCRSTAESVYRRPHCRRRRSAIGDLVPRIRATRPGAASPSRAIARAPPSPALRERDRG